MAQASIRPSDVLHTALSHPRRLVVPVVVITLFAVIYSFVRPTVWEASQALVVRDETGDRLSRPGRFTHSDEMKTLQETVLELAKSRTVVGKALIEIGAPENYVGSWPSEQVLEAVQGVVKVTPPKGAEFGKTEVFYLKVQAESKPRAVALASAICNQLQDQLSELRESKARSTTEELTERVSLAQQEQAETTGTLSNIEQTVGRDLSELRILNESPAGDSDLRRMATELDKELRTYYAVESEGHEFLKLLNEARVDQNKLLASPSVLLKAQPALGRLKDGLVDAQLRTGQLLGTMSEDHPLVQAGRASEQAIRRQLHDEIGIAINGVELDLRVNADRIRFLEGQNTGIQKRLARLAELRADYANLISSSKQRAESLKTVEHELSEARASQVSAHTGSLLSLIDRPETGNRPVGPGRTSTVLAGFGGGLLLALAGLLLSLPENRLPENARPKAPAAPFTQPRSHRSAVLSIREALERATVHG